jgi:glycosyltransferase involved in cell wall biosynthesis
MKVAVVHEWLVTVAGSERVAEQILGLYPDAPLYSLFDFLTNKDRMLFQGKRAYTSLLQHFPLAKTKYRLYLPLMPWAVRRFNLEEYDVILSSSHAVAKGVRKRYGQLHICYCHTPMRYAWDLKEQYLLESGLDRGIKGYIARRVLDRLQAWDQKTSEGVDYFIANSNYISDRIRRAYGRESAVIYPPVDTEQFGLCTVKDNYYLAASRMVPYKRMGLIVEAFAGMPERKLVVIGDGPDFNQIKSKGRANIEFLGYQPKEILIQYLQRARGFIFAAEEDFGILPVEAQACGTPVIAFGKGGSLETVVGLNEDSRSGTGNKRPTGIFFYEQSVDALKSAVTCFERNLHKFDGQEIRKNAIRFSTQRFKREFKEFVDAKIAAKGSILIGSKG